MNGESARGWFGFRRNTLPSRNCVPSWVVPGVVSGSGSPRGALTVEPGED